MEQKGAICTADNSKTDFYSQMFVVPKKDGGHRHKGFVTYNIESINMLKDLYDQSRSERCLLRSSTDTEFNKVRIWKGKVYPVHLPSLWVGSLPRPIMSVLRAMGLRTIMYIDDILILAKSETQAREDTVVLIFLLENLGLVINQPKSQTSPSEVIEFLGIFVDSATMELVGEKNEKIREGYYHGGHYTCPGSWAN